MYIGSDTAWSNGFASYGTTDTCPFDYDELKHAWWSGWFHGLAMAANLSTLVK